MKKTITPLAVLSIFAICFAPALSSAKTAEEVTPLLIGATVPSAGIADQKGNSRDLTDVLKGKRSVVIFYRGGWCPYCNTQLNELAEIEGDLKAKGYQIVAISPDKPDSLNVTDGKYELGYQLYSDSDFNAMNAFGVGYDHKRRGMLPVPSVFIVTPDLQVSFQYVNPNYRFRMPAKLLLAAAETGGEL